MERLRITGGRVLLRSDGEQVVDVSLEDGRIAGIGRDGRGAELDARGLLVLPGIVDIHGDAFERQLQPRPGVGFTADIALHDTEAQLLANGITTAFHGVTLSWEPGLRSLDRVAGAARCAGGAALDLRHARASALGGVQPRCARHRAGRYRGGARASAGLQRPHAADPEEVKDPVVGAKYSDRAGMKLDDFRALAEQVRRART